MKWDSMVFVVSFRYSFLVGGFNPSEKYWSNGKSSPNRGENKKCLKPPGSFVPNCRSVDMLLYFL